MFLDQILIQRRKHHVGDGMGGYTGAIAHIAISRSGSTGLLFNTFDGYMEDDIESGDMTSIVMDLEALKRSMNSKGTDENILFKVLRPPTIEYLVRGGMEYCVLYARSSGIQ